MREIEELSQQLEKAFNLNLIENYYVCPFFIDIDFPSRDDFTVKSMMLVRDYINKTYRDVDGVDYMPILNRLRVYLCPNKKND